MPENYDHYISKNIKAFYKRRLAAPIIYLIVLILAWHFFSLSAVFSPDILPDSGIIGLAVPLVCLVLFGSGSFLLPSMACILVLLLVLRKPIERANGIVPGQTEKQKEAAQ